MNLLAFLKKESPESWKLIITLASLSGIANGILLAIINIGADISGSERPGQNATPHLLLLFAIGMAIFILAKRYSLVLSTQVVEGMLKNTRIRVCDKIRKSELMTLEHLDQGQVFNRISQDMNLISQFSIVVISAGQDVVLLVCSLFYLSWLSSAAFFITVGGTALAIYAYYFHVQATMEQLKKVADKEGELFNLLGHILYGFKELRLNIRKNDSLFRSLTDIAETTRDLKTKSGVTFATTLLFSQVFFYLLLATVVFVLPQYIPTYSSVIVKTTATILFISGPFTMVLNAAPTLSRAEVALDNLYTLERNLDRSLRGPVAGEGWPLTSFADFKKVWLRDVSFTYIDKQGSPTFTVGPINLSVNRGDIIFIVGGNGSGKSTVLKLLTGLYPPDSGAVMVDDRLVNAANAQAYGDLFSAIFSDFHLFDRLYGLEDVAEARVAALIEQMELGDKVRFADGRFSTLDLSTGQRKRLALIVALLEGKEIYIFDEWASDQDQHFRQRFYEFILRDLKNHGKTIIAVTHDDRFWHFADRVVKLDLGRVVSDETSGTL